MLKPNRLEWEEWLEGAKKVYGKEQEGFSVNNLMHAFYANQPRLDFLEKRIQYLEAENKVLKDELEANKND